MDEAPPPVMLVTRQDQARQNVLETIDRMRERVLAGEINGNAIREITGLRRVGNHDMS